ncbi:MAG: quinolinate synthase NadA [Ruminococcaceae bacterium]|nr:quinolinate synthase NadA [Oscillospiraceae bacterium]MBO4972083.1 quinolinate synthase NadA [Clostridia bacterium]MBQ1258563.1 quinolinate synthase NadA [Clostridia bacterium]
MKEQIERLKKEKEAVILAHYYAPSEVQEIADHVGDSFYLAKVAKSIDAKIIVFCGVSFMGESAKILNPNKKVLMPDPTADCPMAHMVKEGKIAEMRAKYDDLAVVCYINSTAELKAQSDVCVTSSNAVRIVKALPNKNIFFIPDKNLGSYVAEQVPEKNIIVNDGYCPIHASITARQLKEEKDKHPGALVLTHPECEKELLLMSDHIGSTAEIISFAKSSDAEEFIICTEDGVLYRLLEENPEKRFFFPDPRPCCTDMKLNTVEGVLSVLMNENNEIKINEDKRNSALIPLEKMLELAK